MPLRLNSLSAKLNLALLALFLILGAATAAFIFAGFRGTKEDATDRSEEALAQQGATLLQFLAFTQADVGSLALEYASEAGHRASRYMQDFKQTGAVAAFDASTLTQTPEGAWYDPRPDRDSDVIVPLHQDGLDADALEDLSYSAPLDALFPALMEGFPGELSGEAYHPTAIAFIGTGNTGRYYPPIGIHESIPDDLDVSSLLAALGPENNPDRTTIWTPPYEDSVGKGLVLTAQIPVYDGDVYRGLFQIDLSVDSLVREVNEILPTDSGFGFYVDVNGEILPTDEFDLLSTELGTRNNEALAEVIERMKAGDWGNTQVVLDGHEFFVAYAPVAGVGGGLAVVAPLSELTAEAAAITAGIDDQADETMLIVLAWMGGLFVLAIVGATYLNRRILVQPIEALAFGTRAVAQGDLSTRIEVQGSGELAELGHSFNQMTEEIITARGDLERQVEERTRELTALLGISNNVASTLEVEPLLKLVIDEVQSLADYHRCSIFRLEDDALVLLDSRGRDDGLASAGMRIALSEVEPIWASVSAGRPVLIDDLHASTSMAEAYRRATDQSFETPFRSWLGVPLALSDRVVGMLALSHADANFYTERHASLAQAIGSQVAVAMENARLYEQAQQLGVVEERQRLARELHDSVSQALYGIALGARTARTLLDSDPSRAVEPVDYVLQLAEAGLAEMRALIFELRPESLETEGLVAALDKQTAATRARHGIEVETEFGYEPAIGLTEKEVFYRVAQEALHNVVKHAHASRAGLRLATDNGSVILEVSDNGAGFDASQSYPGHMGLVSMQERATSVGATLDVESAAGTGTTVRLRFAP